MALNFPTNPIDGELYPNPKLDNFPQFEWSQSTNTWVKFLESKQATETKAGIAQIATQIEVNEGENDTHIVTPKKLYDWTTDVSNPTVNQIQFKRLIAQSFTTHTVSKTTKTFTFSNNPYLEFFIGQRLRAVYNKDIYMDGTVTALSSSSVTLDIDYVKGAALEYSNWTIGISGGDNLSSMSSDNLVYIQDYILNSPELIALILTLS